MTSKKQIVMRINSMMDSENVARLGDAEMAETLIDFLCTTGFDVDDASIAGLLRVAADLKQRRSVELGSEMAAKIIVDKLRNK